MDLIMEQFELDMDILQSKYERVNKDLEFLIRKMRYEIYRRIRYRR